MLDAGPLIFMFDRVSERCLRIRPPKNQRDAILLAGDLAAPVAGGVSTFESEPEPPSTIRPFDCRGFSDTALSRRLAPAFCALQWIDYRMRCPPSAAAVPDRTKADQNNTERGTRVHE
jgi:hypothetical protein